MLSLIPFSCCLNSGKVYIVPKSLHLYLRVFPNAVLVFLFLKSCPITRKLAPYLYVLASNDLFFFGLLFASSRLGTSDFFAPVSMATDYRFSKGRIIAFILNNPGFSSFFCIHCENEGLVLNPGSTSSASRVRNGILFGKDGNVLSILRIWSLILANSQMGFGIGSVFAL